MSVTQLEASVGGMRARIEAQALAMARVAFVGAMAALPISTAATNFALAIGLIAWCFSGRVPEALRLVRREPVAAVAVALFALLCFSALWSPAPAAEQWNALGKFRKLLYIPVVASLFDDAVWRKRVLIAGFVVGVLTLVLSLGSAATGYQFPVAREYPVAGAPLNATVFKQHITQGWMMSLFAFGCLTGAVFVRDRRWRIALYVLGALAIIDNLAFVQARTGHLTTAALLVLWCLLRFGRKGIALAALLLALGAGLMAISGGAFVTRVENTLNEVEQVQAGSTQATSVSHRLAFYRNGWLLAQAAPWTGHGLGSMATVYKPLTVGKTGVEAEVAGNPHNEYLNLALQAGVGATVLFVALLLLLWRTAARAAAHERWLGIALPLALAVSSLANSSLWDFNEGSLFALLAGWTLAAAHSARNALPA